jgi:hypothetical protein
MTHWSAGRVPSGFPFLGRSSVCARFMLRERPSIFGVQAVLITRVRSRSIWASPSVSQAFCQSRPSSSMIKPFKIGGTASMSIRCSHRRTSRSRARPETRAPQRRRWTSWAKPLRKLPPSIVKWRRVKGMDDQGRERLSRSKESGREARSALLVVALPGRENHRLRAGICGLYSRRDLLGEVR